MKRPPSEAEFQRRVTERIAAADGSWFHVTDSRKSSAGFPDLVICLPAQRRMLFRELKAGAGVSPAQSEWLETLTASGADAAVWHPVDLTNGRIDRELGIGGGVVICHPEGHRLGMGLAADAASGFTGYTEEQLVAMGHQPDARRRILAAQERNR